MAERLDDIVKETAAKLDYPPEVITHVITFVFKYCWKFFKSPHKPILRLPYLGSFHISMHKLKHQISLSAKHRHSHFNSIWNLRHMVYNYHKAHKLTFYGKKIRKT